jgi:hypothetical protein
MPTSLLESASLKYTSLLFEELRKIPNRPFEFASLKTAIVFPDELSRWIPSLVFEFAVFRLTVFPDEPVS